MANTTNIINSLRALADELRGKGLEDAADQVEGGADELDRLSDRYSDLEDQLSETKDELADAKDDLVKLEACETSEARLAELEKVLDQLEFGIRKARQACYLENPVPSVVAL